MSNLGEFLVRDGRSMTRLNLLKLLNGLTGLLHISVSKLKLSLYHGLN